MLAQQVLIPSADNARHVDMELTKLLLVEAPQTRSALLALQFVGRDTLSQFHVPLQATVNAELAQNVAVSSTWPQLALPTKTQCVELARSVQREPGGFHTAPPRRIHNAELARSAKPVGSSQLLAQRFGIPNAHLLTVAMAAMAICKPS